MRTNSRKFRVALSALTALTLVVLLLAVLGAAPAWAATPIYVRTGGSDTLCNGTVNVDHSGVVAPNCAFQTVQKGVTDVDDDGTVIVAAGTYSETVTITKTLTLQGADRTTTIIDAGGSSKAAVTVRAGDVVLDGFTFTHSQPYYGDGPAGTLGVGGGVDAAPNGDPNDPAEGRCENLDRELPTTICSNPGQDYNDPNDTNYIPDYLLGGPFPPPGKKCVAIVYPDDFTAPGTSPDWPVAGVNPMCPHALDGTFTLKNSIASNNWSDTDCDGDTPRCYGVKVIATGLVTIDNVEASNNGSDGDCTGHGYQLTKDRGPDGESCFGILAFSVGQGGGLVMTDIVANNNRAQGSCYRHETCFGVMADETLLDVRLERIETKDNGADEYCRGNDTCFGTAADGVEGKVTMIDVVATDNGAGLSCLNPVGITGPPEYHNTYDGLPSRITLNDSCNGVIVDGEDWSLGLDLIRVNADDNGAFGAEGDCIGGTLA